MNKVKSTDLIFATVITCGRTILRTTIGGASTIEEIFCSIGKAINDKCIGPATVILRNGTQGWSLRRTLSRSLTPLRSHIPEGTQLSLTL